MYYANLQDNRVVVRCAVLSEKRIKFISAVYDTGARYTCFCANILNPGLSESDLTGSETKNLAGFISDDASKFYKYDVEQFSFGNIVLGNQTIWITFDERVTTNLVGYDIIRQISRTSIANTDIEYFFATEDELKTYITSL